MRGLKCLLLMFLVWAFAGRVWAGLVWFDDLDPRFPKPQADPYAARFSALFLATDHDASLYQMNLGGEVGLVHPDEPNPGWTLQGRALMVSRFNYSLESFPLENADFEGGLAMAIQRGMDWLEIYGYHRSSHLGGDVVFRGLKEPTNVSAEFFRVLYYKTIGADWRLYAGPNVMVHADPALASPVWGGQAGVAWGSGRWSGGLDVKLREIAAGSGAVAVQAGVCLSPLDARFQQIIQLFLYTGHILGGQYQTQFENILGLGVTVRMQ